MIEKPHFTSCCPIFKTIQDSQNTKAFYCHCHLWPNPNNCTCNSIVNVFKDVINERSQVLHFSRKQKWVPFNFLRHHFKSHPKNKFGKHYEVYLPIHCHHQCNHLVDILHLACLFAAPNRREFFLRPFPW